MNRDNVLAITIEEILAARASVEAQADTLAQLKRRIEEAVAAAEAGGQPPILVESQEDGGQRFQLSGRWYSIGPDGRLRRG